MNGALCQVCGLFEWNGGCSLLISSLQLPPILSHTIRICQCLVFTRSRDGQGQMAREMRAKAAAENEVSMHKTKRCHHSQLSLPFLSKQVWSRSLHAVSLRLCHKYLRNKFSKLFSCVDHERLWYSKHGQSDRNYHCWSLPPPITDMAAREKDNGTFP